MKKVMIDLKCPGCGGTAGWIYTKRDGTHICRKCNHEWKDEKK